MTAERIERALGGKGAKWLGAFARWMSTIVSPCAAEVAAYQQQAADDGGPSTFDLELLPMETTRKVAQ